MQFCSWDVPPLVHFLFLILVPGSTNTTPLRNLNTVAGVLAGGRAAIYLEASYCTHTLNTTVPLLPIATASSQRVPTAFLKQEQSRHSTCLRHWPRTLQSPNLMPYSGRPSSHCCLSVQSFLSHPGSLTSGGVSETGLTKENTG